MVYAKIARARNPNRINAGGHLAILVNTKVNTMVFTKKYAKYISLYIKR